MSDVFISRQPLVNRQSKIIANRLTLHLVDGATTKDASNTLNSLTEFWPEGEKLFFINCAHTASDANLLDWALPPKRSLTALRWQQISMMPRTFNLAWTRA